MVNKIENEEGQHPRAAYAANAAPGEAPTEIDAEHPVANTDASTAIIEDDHRKMLFLWLSIILGVVLAVAAGGIVYFLYREMPPWLQVGLTVLFCISAVAAGLFGGLWLAEKQNVQHTHTTTGQQFADTEVFEPQT